MWVTILGFTIIDELNGKKELDAKGLNVTVNCHLSLTPVMGTVVEPFKSNVYLLDET